VSKRLDLASLKGDLAGGATSAVLTVPVSMGYGVLALLPLGDEYIPVGILAGLSSSAIGRNPDAAGQIRGLAIILAAFAEGLGVLAVVVGLLAIFIK